jgi:hypothetical protein
VAVLSPLLRRGFLTSRMLARAIRNYGSIGPESYFEAGLLKREQHRGLRVPETPLPLRCLALTNEVLCGTAALAVKGDGSD